MSIYKGLVIAGSKVIGSEWCLRDDRAWWNLGDYGTRPRADAMEVLLGHFTAGEAGLRSYEDDGPFVVRGMRSRKRADGSPLNVGIHFVIGACDEDDPGFANVWETADPGLTATCHVNKPWLNARSIGVEVVSAGRPGPADVRNRPRLKVPLLGRTREVLAFYPAQLRSWVRLAETLASQTRAGLRIPRRVPAFGADRRMTRAEARRWAGACEHLHAFGTKKTDASGLLVGALADAGWERVP